MAPLPIVRSRASDAMSARSLLQRLGRVGREVEKVVALRRFLVAGTLRIPAERRSRAQLRGHGERRGQSRRQRRFRVDAGAVESQTSLNTSAGAGSPRVDHPRAGARRVQPRVQEIGQACTRRCGQKLAESIRSVGLAKVPVAGDL